MKSQNSVSVILRNTFLGTMATKRDGDELQAQSTKRARNSKQSHEPQTNITYGQRCCFPGLDNDYANSDEDLEFEDETDALAYLQTVR